MTTADSLVLGLGKFIEKDKVQFAYTRWSSEQLGLGANFPVVNSRCIPRAKKEGPKNKLRSERKNKRDPRTGQCNSCDNVLNK